MESLRGNMINRKYYTSGIMRLVARFLTSLQKVAVDHTEMPENSSSEEQPTLNTLTDYLRPQHFDLCIKSAFECANQDVDDMEELASPSNAIKIGYELKRIVGIKIGTAIRERNKDLKEECLDFLELMKSEWGIRVTKLARLTLTLRKCNEKKRLPLPEDIKKLAETTDRCLKELDLTDKTFQTYHKACELVEAKLISYNRRRPGEVQSIQ
jgi:hypothetical protein